jgi:hypothetical protein
MLGIIALNVEKSSSSQYKTIKIRELEVGKEYYIKKITKTKCGCICTTLNTDIKFMVGEGKTKKLTKAQLRDEKNNISFYANKPFSAYIRKNNTLQCYLKLTELKQVKIKDEEYTVPENEIYTTERSRGQKQLRTLKRTSSS